MFTTCKRLILAVFVGLISVGVWAGESTNQPSIPMKKPTEWVSIEKAKERSGVYLMDGGRFCYLDQMRPGSLLFEGGGSDIQVQMLDSDHSTYTVPNTAQLVLVAQDRVYFYPVANSGYTVSCGVMLGFTKDGYFAFPNYFRGSDFGYNQATYFETVNSKSSHDFNSRVLRTGENGVMNQIYGVIVAQKDEVFTLGKYEGTDYKETKLKADKQFFAFKRPSGFTLGGVGGGNIATDVEIERTKDGYFKIVFKNPPEGLLFYRYGGTGNGAIVHMYNPTPNPDAPEKQ